MAKKDQTEKKENPLLISILALFCGIVCFFTAKTHDLEIFFLITIPGKIVFPILGVLLLIISVFQFKTWLTQRKNR